MLMMLLYIKQQTTYPGNVNYKPEFKPCGDASCCTKLACSFCEKEDQDLKLKKMKIPFRVGMPILIIAGKYQRKRGYIANKKSEYDNMVWVELFGHQFQNKKNRTVLMVP